jgi:hypothetical protein
MAKAGFGGSPFVAIVAQQTDLSSTFAHFVVPSNQESLEK